MLGVILDRHLVGLSPGDDLLLHGFVAIPVPLVQQSQPARGIFEITERTFAFDGPPQFLRGLGVLH